MSSRDLLPDHPAELTLLEYLVGDLPHETSDRIRRHVAACRGCRRTIADLSMTVDELDRLPTVPVPHDLPVAADEVGVSRPARLARILTIVAVVVAALGVAGVLRLNDGGRSESTLPTRLVLRLPAEPRDAAWHLTKPLPSDFRPRVTQDLWRSNLLTVNVAPDDLGEALRRLHAVEPVEGGRVYTIDVGTMRGPSLEPVRRISEDDSVALP